MATTTVRVQINGQLLWIVERGNSGHWIAVCDPMNLSLEATSLDELYSVINEGIQLLMLDLIRDNEFDQFLRERGWDAQGVPKGPVEDGINIQIPWDMLIKAPHGDNARRAT
jgi:hypothetical protein